MEPFGLFQFLQNLLNTQGESAETPPVENAPVSASEEPTLKSENAEPPIKNAAVEFLENHERRAKRRR